MTHDEKIAYMKISAGIAGFGITHAHLDLLVTIYEHVLETKGKGTIMDCVEIEDKVGKRAETKHKQDILNKVSDKH